MTTQGMPSFEYLPPGRGAVDKILISADKAAANKTAVDEIRDLCNTLHNHAVIPSRKIRQILKKHGLA
jgi:hypothetical protein